MVEEARGAETEIRTVIAMTIAVIATQAAGLPRFPPTAVLTRIETWGRHREKIDAAEEMAEIGKGEGTGETGPGTREEDKGDGS